MDTRVNVIDPTGRVDTTGPVLYLMRLLVRQFGFTCLQRVSQAHPWVVPESLRRVDNVSACSGWVNRTFLFYCCFRRINQLTCRFCMSWAIRMLGMLLTRHCSPTKQQNSQCVCRYVYQTYSLCVIICLRVQSGAEVCLLAFAFYQKATLSRASTAPADQIREEVLTKQ